MMLRLATHAMGTRFELVLAGEDQPRLRAAGEEALAVVQEWHGRLNRFAKDSQLSFLNRTASERAVCVDEDLFELLSLCKRVWRVSGGSFDPTVAAAMDVLRGDAQDASKRCTAPGMHVVELDEQRRTVRFAMPGVALDLGGVAKGFALDKAAAVLRACGVSSALMHGGTSSIVAIGAPPDREGWVVVVESEGEPARVVLRDVHLSVSSPGGRTYGTMGGVSGHILDPRDCLSVPLHRTAAVLGGSGAEVEAWSTALVVLGHRPEELHADSTTALHDPANGWDFAGAQRAKFHIAPAMEVA
jgi:FAD:protein FMN transferase